MFERPLKLRHDPERSEVFFTSDTHFNHNKEFIYKNRGYNSVQEHNTGVINIINNCVKPDDVLIHLGDFCLNITMFEYEDILRKINCKNIYYIWGNHNSCIRRSYDLSLQRIYTLPRGQDIPALQVYPHKDGKITYLGDYKELIVNGQMIIISHYPIQIYNQMQRGAWHLSGHSHYNNPTTRAESTENKVLDVGWDGHNKPLSFWGVMEIMKTKNHVKLDKTH
jgi:calcineurin-like phosphoesterase family protein